MSVLTELRDNTMVITINRPEAGNALNGDVGRGLVEAFDAALADDAVRCIILTGAGEKIFCAGMDLKAFAAGEDIRPVGQALAKLASCPKPLIAAVNGHALAGGFELVLKADLVVVADGAVDLERTDAAGPLARGALAMVDESGAVGLDHATDAEIEADPIVSENLALDAEL